MEALRVKQADRGESHDKKVEHVALIVKDMDQSIEFYGEMFGFKLRTRGHSHTEIFLYHEEEPGFELELIQDLQPQVTSPFLFSKPKHAIAVADGVEVLQNLVAGLKDEVLPHVVNP